MNAIVRPLLLASAIVAVAASSAAADRFTETRARIDSLLGARLKPAGIPADLPNPFAVGSGRPVAQDNTPGVVQRADDDQSVLGRFASTLRFGGLLRLGDVPHRAINSIPYKEGDLIKIPDTEPAEYVRVSGITQRELVLTYRSAVLRIAMPL